MELTAGTCNRCILVRFFTTKPRFTFLFIKVLLVLVCSIAGHAISQEHELLLQHSKKGTKNIISHSCIHDQIIEQRKRPGFKVYSISPQVYKEKHTSHRLQRKGRALLEASEFSGKQDNAKQPIRIFLNYEAVGHTPDRDCRNVGDIVKLGEPSLTSVSNAPSCNPHGDPPVSADCWYNCTLDDIAGEDKKHRLRKALGRTAYWFKRALSVERVRGNLQLSGYSACGQDGGVPLPREYVEEGVADADLVLLVTTRPTTGNTLAWAVACERDQRGRAIAGHVNVAPRHLTAESETLLSATLIHEVMHVLGFDPHAFTHFRDERRRRRIQSDETNLRRSTRKRRLNVNLEGFIDSSGSDDNDLMNPNYRGSRSRINSGANKGESLPRREPRRAGLRPRRGRTVSREQLNGEYDNDEEASSDEEKVSQDAEENPKDSEDQDVDDGEGEDEVGGDGDREDEGEDEDDGEEDDDDDEGEEQEGRRRYDLRNRADVRRLSMEESKQRPRSPRRVLQQGMGTKVNRDVRRGGPRVHKRHHISRADDSDDSLLVDEMDQGPPIPWGRGGSRAGPPWLLGGLDMHGTTAWGLNAAASGWSHQSDAITNLTSGIQTAGPSSKGGADIQPLQIDESVSFNDIGGLSEYIDALKEMVFFPLLYPDFFANYHITPPRGVLLCGPPGTGKTLIARALACAASKAGQNVSFYMRKGADVLSKWVGEAERQLKLLFEEAQRNQPSIIFFDEIDGLAPVRSSKQEQIHNSIVSTLLALMDGLDSRGQVVLIGATNRIDAIDGALRRPGRFDREFNFQLPGCDARAEILDIHTRKWKQPPTNELKLELAASCVGYCGADLKALCTEAAIRAFREKYPQVYTSDDKFVIDVDSVEVKKYHFIEAMSTITPAAHRGSIVQSRPLSSVVAPCLNRQFQKIMSTISDIFPVVSVSSELSKLSKLSYGSGVPLVYRPRLLLCGGDGVGLDHLGPAILHELEKFPVHSLGLPSLLSDPSAKTPEEALVHIFGEARRTTPSILYLPQFHLWVQNAHEQLKAVLWTLLEELPSDFPVLLLGTCSLPLVELDTDHLSVFQLHNVYVVHKPSMDDRSIFFDRLVQAALSISNDIQTEDSHKSASLPELPKAPKVDTGPKVSELKVRAETEGHALRRLRMCLRDICNRILYDKRFSAFHYPVIDEDAPNYRSIIQIPMDMATLLQHVDSGKYITCKAFLEDFDLILINAKRYNGDDYNGARIVSRAYELRDTVHGMLSQVDPALAAFCDKIAAEGGPLNLPDDLGGSLVYQAPVVQIATMTRASARLRNVQPEVNLDQSYEALKRIKKNSDAAQAVEIGEEDLEHQELVHSKAQEPEVVDTNHAVENLVAESSPTKESREESREVIHCTTPDVNMSEAEDTSRIESIKQRLVERSEDYGIPQLERLYARVIKGVFDSKAGKSRDLVKDSILSYLLKFVEDDTNF